LFFFLYSKDIEENMTEETQQSTETSVATQQSDQHVSNTTSEASKTKEGKKEKCRPMTKVSFFIKKKHIFYIHRFIA
jgi:hypothetical protein